MQLPEIPLQQLPVGQSARVRRVVGEAGHIHRLEEFGIRSGAVVRMFRPGNPCIIHLGGTKVCLRPDELLEIFVEPSGSPRGA